jgi:hypothetical protein
LTTSSIFNELTSLVALLTLTISHKKQQAPYMLAVAKMSSTSVKIGAGGGKIAQSNPSSMTSSNPSILLDKFNGRRSTPDSEALASSDDEAERQDQHQAVAQPQKPARRASWLNDMPQAGVAPRKNSFASSSMSPTTSHPS